MVLYFVGCDLLVAYEYLISLCLNITSIFYFLKKELSFPYGIVDLLLRFKISTLFSKGKNGGSECTRIGC